VAYALEQMPIRRSTSRSWLGDGFVLLIFLACCAALLFLEGDVRVIFWPICFVLLVVVWFLVRVGKAAGIAPIAEVGAWYVVAGTVYMLLPLLVYLALGLVFAPTSDGRLFALQPDSAEVARIGWMYAAHISAFAVAYVLFRRGSALASRRIDPIPAATSTLAVALCLLLSVVLAIVKVAMPTADSYSGSYAAVAALPLVVRQALKFLNGANLVLTIIVLVVAFQNYKRWRRLLFAWILFEGFFAIVVGSRTGLVISFCAFLLLYHTMVRPIAAGTAAFLGIAAVVLFMALGLLRAYRGFDPGTDSRVAINGGEFEALFANVADLDRRRSAGEIDGAPPGAYLADLIAPIPSQLLPFEKTDLADWYISRFYPEAKEQGQGYAFGVVAQSVLGFGWIELILRGVVLGVLFALIHRFYARHRNRLWVVVFYVWIIVNCYQSFRATSLSLWTYFVQQFVPMLIIIEVLSAVMARASQPSGTLPPIVSVSQE
jgi:oligosaccharide repeat unit polymerase